MRDNSVARGGQGIVSAQAKAHANDIRCIRVYNDCRLTTLQLQMLLRQAWRRTKEDR
jgi:hypothetical protein